MRRAVAIPLDQKVPGTKFTARQICRTRRYTGPLRKGVLLAFNGAYDNKYVVDSVELVTAAIRHPRFRSGPGQPESLYDHYRIGVRRLGKFFADGRVQATPFRRAKTVTIYDAYLQHGKSFSDDRCLPCGSFRFAPVEPSGAELLRPNPYLKMDEVERQALFDAQWARDLEFLLQNPQLNNPTRTDRQQKLIDAVKDRSYERADFVDLLPAALAKIKAREAAAAAWKSGTKAGEISKLYVPIAPKDPEAVLEMFRIK